MPENLTSWQIFQEVRHQKLMTGDLNLLAIFALLDELKIQGEQRQKVYSDIRLLFSIFAKHQSKKDQELKASQQLSNHKNLMRGQSK